MIKKTAEVNNLFGWQNFLLGLRLKLKKTTSTEINQLRLKDEINVNAPIKKIYKHYFSAFYQTAGVISINKTEEVNNWDISVFVQQKFLFGGSF